MRLLFVKWIFTMMFPHCKLNTDKAMKINPLILFPYFFSTIELAYLSVKLSYFRIFSSRE